MAYFIETTTIFLHIEKKGFCIYEFPYSSLVITKKVTVGPISRKCTKKKTKTNEHKDIKGDI